MSKNGQPQQAPKWRAHRILRSDLYNPQDCKGATLISIGSIRITAPETGFTGQPPAKEFRKKIPQPAHMGSPLGSLLPSHDAALVFGGAACTRTKTSSGEGAVERVRRTLLGTTERSPSPGVGNGGIDRFGGSTANYRMDGRKGVAPTHSLRTST